MSFNVDSIRSTVSTFFTKVSVSAKEAIAELQENPSEFLSTNAKTMLVFGTFLASLVYAPLLTVGAGIVGTIYCKNVSRMEDDFISFFSSRRSQEARGVAAVITAIAFHAASAYMIPLAIGAHVGMLFGDSYVPTAKRPERYNPEGETGAGKKTPAYQSAPGYQNTSVQ